MNTFWLSVLIGAVCVVFIMLIVATQKIRHHLQLEGFGFLSFHIIAFSLARRPDINLKSLARLADWGLGEKLGPLAKFLRLVKFAIRIKELKIRWDAETKRCCTHVDKCVLLLGVTVNTLPTDKRKNLRFTQWLVRLLLLLVPGIIKIIQKLWVFRINDLRVILLFFPENLDIDPDYWNTIELNCQNLTLLPTKAKLLEIALISAIEHAYSKVDSSRFVQRKVLNLSQIQVTHKVHVTPEKVSFLSVSLEGLSVDCWPSTLLFLASILNNSDESKEPASPLASRKFWEQVGLTQLGTIGLDLTIKKVDGKIHLPLMERKIERFQSLNFKFDDIKGLATFNTREFNYKLLIACQDAIVLSQNALEIAPELISVIARLQGHDVELCGNEESLLKVHRFTISNFLPKDFDKKGATIDENDKDYIKAVLKDNPLWKISNISTNCKLLKQISSNIVLESSLFNIFADSNDCLLLLLGSDYIVPKIFTIFGRASEITFKVPFEYPLSNLFDHLACFIKIGRATLEKTSDRQDFYLFDKKWQLIVQSDKVVFSIADSPWETRLSKCYSLKRLIWSKLERMDMLFWKRCRDEINILGDSIAYGWVPPELRPLAKASSFPDILRGNLNLTNLYVELQKSLFKLFKHHIRNEQEKEQKPLFAVQGSAVHFGIGWDPDFIKEDGSMASLINSIEAGGSFNDEQVQEFGVFLGGLLNISISKLLVSFRDYFVPLCQTDCARLRGLVFLIEEPSYEEARSVFSVPILRGGELTGTANLRGLDENFCARVSRTILPLKIYHSVVMNLFSPEERPIIGGFSPLFEGVFQMLDRAFELFSKPSEEPSPSLPFWDKLRLLFRGAFSSIVVSSPCRVICLAGNDLNSTNENITMVFPRGFSLGLEEGNIVLEVEESAVLAKSHEWVLLNWHHIFAQSFSSVDTEVLRKIGIQLKPDELPVIIFPKLRFEAISSFLGFDDRPTITHNQLRICATSKINGPLTEGFDSYRFFRIRRLQIILRITSLAGIEGNLFGHYYREFERFISKGFCRYITPPVMGGKLFKFGTLVKTATPKLSSVLTDFQLQLAYDGQFSVRGLQYYDMDIFGGAILRSEGRTRLHLAWRKSDYKQPLNSNYGKWYLHFAEYDFSHVKIGILDKDFEEEGSRGNFGKMPTIVKYPNVSCYEVLRAPRLFYIVINEDCFKHDPEASNSQQKVLEEHVASLACEIDQLAQKLRRTDPNEDLTQFSELKRQLSVLLEQNEYFSRFLQEPGEAVLLDHPRASNHHIIIQNAYLQWHQRVRDAVFALIDQQFQYFRCDHAMEWSAARTLEIEERRSSMSIETMAQLSARRISSPLSPSSNAPSAEELFEQLINQQVPWEAGHEDLATEKLGNGRRHLLFCDPHDLYRIGAFVSKRIDISFVAPQLVFLDDTADSDSAILVTAHSAVVKYGTVLQSEYGEMIGRRTKIVLNNALIHGAFHNDFDTWPPTYPVEYLLSKDTEISRFHKISDKFTVTLVYDVSNKRMKSTSLTSPIRRIFGKGDNLRVEVERINLETNSELYTVLYNVIVRLLVYRDPTQMMRSEQLESLALATNIFNQSEIARNIWEMWSNVLMRKNSMDGKASRAILYGQVASPQLIEEYCKLKVPWDELALVIDAVRAAKETQEKSRQKQTRLVLDVSIGSIKWTVMKSAKVPLGEFSLEGIHDNWISAEDGCQSNLIEIKNLKALNRLPDAFYKTLITPVSETIKKLMHSETGYRGIGTQGNTIRFFFKARPPVGGIIVVEHCELNLSPLQIQLTYDIAEELFKFFFPSQPNTMVKKDPKIVSRSLTSSKENLSETESLRSSRSTSNLADVLVWEEVNEEKRGIAQSFKAGIQNTTSSFISRFTDRIGDTDVEVMKTRATENVSFVYIIVPGSQHLISYKGRGESSITDVEAFLLKLPDFEYHSLVISWLEFLLKLRKDAIRVVLSNVGALVKDKIKRLGQANVPESEATAAITLTRTASRLSSSPRPSTETQARDFDEEKVRMLFGRGFKK